MANPRPTLLKALRQRVLHLELSVGLGALAATLGAVVAAPIVVALMPWALHSSHATWKLLLVHTLLSRLWIYAVLPVLWLFIARLFAGLRPWTAALLSGGAGEVGYLFLDYLGGTLASLIHQPRVWIPRVLTLALGLWLSRKAIGVAQRSREAKSQPTPPPISFEAPSGK
jgi:hypothetical protein